MNLFNTIFKLTAGTYLFVAWLFIAIPLAGCIYLFTYHLTANFLATLSNLLPILS